jgi:glycosyltransferase involved in cell wall biosynthesis
VAPLLKILHVVDSMGGGGMENGVVNIARNLPREIFDVHVCCLRRGGVFSERLPAPEKLHVLNKTPGFSFSCIRMLRQRILQIKPDIIHTHNLGPLIYTSFASFFGRSWPIVHGEHAELTPDELAIRRKVARKLMYRGCRRVHTVSNQLRNHFIELGFTRNNICTILNGVDTNTFIPPPDKEKAKQHFAIPGLSPDDFIIGSVGRFGTFKRHTLLVSAFDKLASLHKNVILILAGDDGPGKSQALAAISSSKHNNRIHWLGFQKNIVPFYQGIDLLVAPSINEGMSNAVLEAMACEVPILANTACGNTEILGASEGGTLASMNNPPELTQLLSSQFKNRGTLGEKGIAARKNVTTRFSIDQMTVNYGNLYQQVARQ